MSASVMKNDRLVELLVQRATEGLSANEQVELNRLLADGSYSDADQFEATAAALTLASIGEEEPLPDALRSRLEQQADAFTFDTPQSTVTTLPSRSVAAPLDSTPSKLPWLAAAACAALAVAGWWPRVEEERGEIDVLTQASADLETIQRARERLLAQASVMQWDWKPTEDPAGRTVTGDVVWDAASQVGYMRFRGLPTNDPQQTQYQLWIFDTTRGDQYPVDGGVFNVPSTSDGEVVVPILAKLPVRNPGLFAVTIEKPGGVVVSARERIVAMAPAETG